MVPRRAWCVDTRTWNGDGGLELATCMQLMHNARRQGGEGEEEEEEEREWYGMHRCVHGSTVSTRARPTSTTSDTRMSTREERCREAGAAPKGRKPRERATDALETVRLRSALYSPSAIRRFPSPRAADWSTGPATCTKRYPDPTGLASPGLASRVIGHRDS